MHAPRSLVSVLRLCTYARDRLQIDQVQKLDRVGFSFTNKRSTIPLIRSRSGPIFEPAGPVVEPFLPQMDRLHMNTGPRQVRFGIGR